MSLREFSKNANEKKDENLKFLYNLFQKEAFCLSRGVLDVLEEESCITMNSGTQSKSGVDTGPS